MSNPATNITVPEEEKVPTVPSTQVEEEKGSDQKA